MPEWGRSNDFSKSISCYRKVGLINNWFECLKSIIKCVSFSAIHPQSNHRTFFLGIQTVVMLYNAWVIPLRFAFASTYQPDSSDLTWAALDYFCDGIYIFDMVVIKTRIMFLNDSGIFERDRRSIVRNYVKKGTFRRDLLSLLPLDIFYLVLGFDGRSAFLRWVRFDLSPFMILSLDIIMFTLGSLTLNPGSRGF